MWVRRVGSALAAIALAFVVAVAVPTSAEAVTAVPPVEPVPVLPSVAAKSLTGTSLGDSTVVEWLIAMAKYKQAAQAAGTTTEVVAPLTKAGLLARGAGGVGAALTAFNVGWAAGQGGLVLYGLATGTSYETLVCAQAPSWYQTANSFLLFGGPDCKAAIPQPIQGETVVGGSLTYNGTEYRRVYGPVGGGYYDSVQQVIKIMCEYRPTLPSGFSVTITNSAPRVSYVHKTWGSDTCPNYDNNPFMMSPFDMGTYTLKNASGVAVATMKPVIKQQADENRTPSCKITWQDGTSTTGTGTSYTENGGIPTTSTGLGCGQAYTSKPGAGPGLMPSKIDVDSTDETGAKTSISSQDVPSFDATETKSMSPSVPGRGLVLEKTVNGVTDSCMTWAADCSNWWTKTSNGTTTGTATETFRCTFGGDVVPLTQCSVYQHTFDTRTSTPVVTVPSTGTDTPWVTKTDPMNTTNPGVSATSDPGGQCMAEWPSAPDPISWVLQPIKCALVWAFVPRASVVTTMQTTIGTTATTTGVKPLLDGLMTLPAAFSGASGCSGLPFHLEGPGWSKTGYLFAACDEPMAGIAATVRGIMTVVISLGAALACLRYASSLFGFIPFGQRLDEDAKGGKT